MPTLVSPAGSGCVFPSVGTCNQQNRFRLVFATAPGPMFRREAGSRVRQCAESVLIATMFRQLLNLVETEVDIVAGWCRKHPSEAWLDGALVATTIIVWFAMP